jgi:RNase P subunit RPR2
VKLISKWRNIPLPQVVICKNCKYIIYKGIELKSAEEIIQTVGGICPNCGRKLSFNIDDIDISPITRR